MGIEDVLVYFAENVAVYLLNDRVILTEIFRRVEFFRLQRTQPFICAPESRVFLQSLHIILGRVLLLRL
jgi:hypothetical protein